jgi:hypothetical protein
MSIAERRWLWLPLLLLPAACQRPTVPSGWPPGAAPYVEAAQLIGPGARPGDFTRANAATPLQQLATCNLERIDGKAFADGGSAVAAKADFVVSGYAIDTAHELVPTNLRLRAVAADGSIHEAALRTGFERPDVPAYFRIGGWARRSGFEGKLSAASLRPGEYRLYLAFAHDATLYACDNGRRLRVTP